MSSKKDPHKLVDVETKSYFYQIKDLIDNNALNDTEGTYYSIIFIYIQIYFLYLSYYLTYPFFLLFQKEKY